MATLEQKSKLAPGERVGDYEVYEKIGQGGVAEIYRGRQISLEREIAMKVLSARASIDSDLVARFERESKIVARLNHPNIVHVIDRGMEGGRYYFVMDYVSGTDFREILLRGTYSLEQKINVIIQVLKALDYAHKNKVIHRDIKPSNILIDLQDHVLVADFGIAQFTETGVNDRTSTNVVMGTMSYMSPEQKTSSRNVTLTTDIYSIGVMLYEIITGTRPMGHFKKPSELNPEVPTSFDEIVLKCLCQEPAERFQSAVALKDAILKASADSSKQSEEKKAIKDQVTAKDFVGRCVFLDTIKETKYGATYLVENRADGSLYIIKKLINRQLGLKESKLLAKLDHPNIIKIFGAGGDASKNVIVSEYAQGGSLDSRMANQFDVESSLAIFRQIANGLQFAHRHNIVHGNLRPSNIMFDNDETVKLCDFALPEHYSGSGTNWYSAPERKKTRLSDIYSAGVVLHLLLIKKLPLFDTYGRLIWQPVDTTIPFDVRDLIHRMLKKSPKDRCQSFGEVLKILDDYSVSIQAARNAPRIVAEKSESIKKFRLSPFFIALIILLAAAIILLALFGGEWGVWDAIFDLTSGS